MQIYVLVNSCHNDNGDCTFTSIYSSLCKAQAMMMMQFQETIGEEFTKTDDYYVDEYDSDSLENNIISTTCARTRQGLDYREWIIRAQDIK